MPWVNTRKGSAECRKASKKDRKIIVREEGESQEFISSEEPGIYTAELDTSFLRTGVMFQVQVFTEDGNEFGNMMAASPLSRISGRSSEVGKNNYFAG
jgi:hypothetical protein